jgi:hypothetical protein
VVVSGKLRASKAELEGLIGDEAGKLGPWPAGLTVRIYPIGQTWSASVKANSPRDALFRDHVAGIIGTLRRKYDLTD